MTIGDLNVNIKDFIAAPVDERKAWVQFFYDRGATQNDLAKILGTSSFTVSKEFNRIGANHPCGSRPPEVKQKWLDYLEDPELDIHRGLDEWDLYAGEGEDNSYPLTDADFEGYAEKIVADRKEENPVILKPISGSVKYFGTPAQIAETWFKSMPDRKVMVTITWE